MRVDSIYTAFDDVTHVWALRIYRKHTQENAIQFIDNMLSKSPSRLTWSGRTTATSIRQSSTCILSISGAVMARSSPGHSGAIERWNVPWDRGAEFYQLLSFNSDVDLNRELTQCVDFYNLHRHHGSLKGRTPYADQRSDIKKRVLCRTISGVSNVRKSSIVYSFSV